MEEDVEMENGFESDYPDPYPDSPMPYPGLSHDFSATYRPIAPKPQQQAVPPTPSTSTSQAYTTLADYFNIGNISNNRLRVLDGVKGGTFETPRSRREDAVNGGEDSGDASDSSSSHSPWTTPFFQRYGSDSPQPEDTPLPGYHALPETDTYYNQTPPSLPDRYPGAVQTPRYESPYSEPSTPRGRGRGRTPRGSRRGSGRGSRGGWRRVLQGAVRGTEHADIFKTPRMPRDPTAKRRGRKKGPTIGKHIDPGEAYKIAAADANQAYFAEDYESALEHTFKAIQANPEVYHGHVLLSEILEKQGRMRDSAYAFTNGAAVRRDPKIWLDVADRYLALADTEEDPDDIASALRCYSEATRLDKQNCEIREAKLRVLLEIEDWSGARMECKGLVRIRPAELDYVRQYASLCNMTGRAEERDRAYLAYETAFKLLADQPSLGKPDEQWDHLNIYLDLLNKANRPQDGIVEAKRLARWFLGRKADTFWDDWDMDDREFDTDNVRRRHVWQFQQGRITRDLSKYGDNIPLDIRVKMGMFRAQMGPIHQPEAIKHFEHLRQLSDEIADYSDMFLDVAECLRKATSPEAAITFYEPVKAHLDLVDENSWMGLGQCYERVDRNDDAEECYLKTIEVSKDHIGAHMALVKLYHATGQSVKAHSMANEIIRLGYKGLLLKERINVSDKSAPKGTGITSHPAKKQRTLLPARPVKDRPRRGSNLSGLAAGDDDDEADAEDNGLDNDGADGKANHLSNSTPSRRLQEQKPRVQFNYAKLKELWPSFESRKDEEAAQQWIQHASEMAKDFRTTKEFFPTQSKAKYFTKLKNGTRMQGSQVVKDMLALKQTLQNNVGSESEAIAMQSIEEGAPSDFHDIAFAEWHRVLSTLAIAYAEGVQQDKCYDVLQNILMRANVFVHDAELKNTTLAICICCALMFNDNKFMTETVHQWNYPGLHRSSKSTQLVAASGYLGHGESHFYHRNTQGRVQFAVKQQDFLAMTPDMRSTVDWGSDTDRLNELSKRNGGSSEELDAGLLTTYAHMVGSKHGHSNLALSYLYRALALQPTNVIVNLSIAITYLATSMRNDAENGQYTMVQGQAFLHRYYYLRAASGTASHLQEAEYNMGRAWHMIRRTHLAVPAYEKVLELSERVQREAKADDRVEGGVEDFAKEAALALRSIYIAAGNQDAARAITEAWLVL